MAETDGQGLLTPWRLRWYPRVLAGALAAATLVAGLTARGSTALTGRLGGDLPAFLGAARLVDSGRLSSLYDWEAQAAAQVGLHGPDTGDFLAFAYPPFVAAAYVPLTRVPYPVAWAIHSLLMAGALYGAVALVAATSDRIRRHRFSAFCAALTFLPMFRAVTGGQNTALTALLLAACWWGLHHRREVLAGIAAGLVLYKPQLALPVGGLLLAGRHGRAVAGFALSGGLLYLAGAAVAGWGWPGWWWSQVAGFHATDQAVNAPNSVGLLGFAEAVLGPGEPVALALGGGLAALAALGLALAWWLRLSDRGDRMGLAVVGTILVPPHAMVYDAALVVLALAAIGRRGRQTVPGLLALWLGALLSLASGWLSFNPAIGVVVAAGAWLAVLAWRDPRPG